MTKPFIYINISGGIAEENTYGNVDTLMIDWDNYHDHGDYEVEDINAKIVELKEKWPTNIAPEYRNRILTDLREIRQNAIDAIEDEDTHTEYLREQVLMSAEQSLTEAGYTVVKP